MRRTDIAIVYQHVPRELDVVCAVASIARREFDLSVEIVQWPCGVPEALGQIRPRLVVLPFCYYWGFFSNLLAEWRRAVFVNLAWEQLLYEGNRGGKTPSGEFALRHVLHHAWTKDYVEYLIQLGVPREHIMLNGHPSYMLYCPPYRDYFKDRATLAHQYGFDPAKRWVFFPENYNWAYYDETVLNDFIQAGTRAEDVYAMRDYCRQSLREVLLWLDSLAQDDRFEVLVRPRPLTPLEDFRRVVAGLVPELSDKLHFSKGESVREWILASDITVSSYSTSLIEAGVAGKPSYMFEPSPLPQVMRAAWHDRMPRVRSRTELEAVCAQAGESGPNTIGRWAREHMLGRGDAIWRIAEFLAKCLSTGATVPPIAPRGAVTAPGRLPLPLGLLYEYRRLRDRRKLRDPSTVAHEVYRHRGDIVAPAEIERRIDRWDDLLAGYKPEALGDESPRPLAMATENHLEVRCPNGA